MHRLLASIEYSGQPPESAMAKALDLIKTGEYAPGELQEVQSTLKEFLSLPEVATWFEPRPGRAVHREIELADRRGRLFRADRVVVDPEVVTVIDFKSGSDKDRELAPDYYQQLKGYMSMLSDIFPGKKLAGILMYPDLKKVERI